MVNVRQNQYAGNNTSNRGFTLSELLITLAVLGVIAAFTIPKILEAQGRQEAQAKIREAVATLESVWYTRKIKGLPPAMSLYESISPNINVLAGSPGIVPNGILPATHPCGKPPGPGMIPAIYRGWMQFHNGVVITGMMGIVVSMDTYRWDDPSHTPEHNYLLCLDYNGKQGPNMPGIDIFYGNFNQWGAFTGPPPSENAQNFNWGSTAIPGQGHVYGYGGAAPIYADSGSVPPAVVGVFLEK